MVSDQLLTYIKTQLDTGYSTEAIKAVLLQSGYQQAVIDEAFLQLAHTHTQSLPTPQISSTVAYTNPIIDTTTNAQASDSSRFKPPPLSKKRSLFIGIPIIVLLFLALGGYLYATNMPSYVLAQAYSKTATIKTISYDATMKLSFQFDFALPFSSMSSSPSSTLQYSDPYTQTTLPSDQPAKKLQVTAHMTGSSDLTKPAKHSYMADISIGDGDLNSIGAGIEGRFINDTSYIRIAKLPDFGLFDTKSFTNQWIKIDKNDLNSPYGSVTYTTATPTLSEVDQQKLRDMIKKAQFISVAKVLPSEEIENQNSYHYQLHIDKTKLKTFINDSSTIISKTAAQQASDQSLIKAIDNVNFSDTQIWVSKSQKFVTRFLVAMNSSNKLKTGNFSLSIDTKMKNFNQPVSILTPIDAKTTKEIFQEMLPVPSSGSAYPNLPSRSINPQYPHVLGDKTQREDVKNDTMQITQEQMVLVFLLQKSLGM